MFFKTKTKVYVKSAVIFKKWRMDIDNNKLLITARGGGITEPKTY